MKKINWNRVWKKFDEWDEKINDYPSLSQRREKIQSLVEAQLKVKRKK